MTLNMRMCVYYVLVLSVFVCFLYLLQRPHVRSCPRQWRALNSEGGRDSRGHGDGFVAFTT
jgi:hypothetical protein